MLTCARVIGNQSTDDLPGRNPAYPVFGACADFPELREHFVQLIEQSPGLDAVPRSNLLDTLEAIDRVGREYDNCRERLGYDEPEGWDDDGHEAPERPIRGRRLHRGQPDRENSGSGGSGSPPAGVPGDARPVRTHTRVERVRGRSARRHDDTGQHPRACPEGQDQALRARAGAPPERRRERRPELERQRVSAAETRGCPGAVGRPGRQTPRHARHVRYAQGSAGAVEGRARPPLGQDRREDIGVPPVSGRAAVDPRHGGYARSRTRPRDHCGDGREGRSRLVTKGTGRANGPR